MLCWADFFVGGLIIRCRGRAVWLVDPHPANGCFDCSCLNENPCYRHVNSTVGSLTVLLLIIARLAFS